MKAVGTSAGPYWTGVLLLVLGLTVGGRAGPLTIATYNVENYTAADRLTEDGYRRDYPKPEVAKQALRTVLRALNADVLVLQEIGPRPYLVELQRDLRADGLDYPYAELVEAADEARHIAVLAKVAPTKLTVHGDLRFKYFNGQERVKRGLLELTLTTPAGELTLWAVHLKSRFTERPDDPQAAVRRAGEAVAIRDLVLLRHPDPAVARFLLLGDFNAAKNSRPLRAMQERGQTRIAHLLPASDSRGERWTHFYAREESYERVDFFLVSPGLRPWVVGDGAVITDSPETRLASDHRPLVLQLQIP